MGLAGQNSEREDHRSQVQRVLLVALGVNGRLLLKLTIGLLRMLALLADAMHSATDGLSPVGPDHEWPLRPEAP